MMFDYESYYEKMFLTPAKVKEVRMDDSTGETYALVQNMGRWFVVFDEETATEPLDFDEAMKTFNKYTKGWSIVYPDGQVHGSDVSLSARTKKVRNGYKGYIVASRNGKYLWSKSAKPVRKNKADAMIDADRLLDYTKEIGGGTV